MVWKLICDCLIWLLIIRYHITYIGCKGSECSQLEPNAATNETKGILINLSRKWVISCLELRFLSLPAPQAVATDIPYADIPVRVT